VAQGSGGAGKFRPGSAGAVGKGSAGAVGKTGLTGGTHASSEGREKAPRWKA
jgi:hypothetical protein